MVKYSSKTRSRVRASIPGPSPSTERCSALPDTLVPTAWTEAEGGGKLIMAMHHRDFPIHGVQFHPESIASEHGHRILANFLAIARFANAPARAA